MFQKNQEKNTKNKNREKDKSAHSLVKNRTSKKSETLHSGQVMNENRMGQSKAKSKEKDETSSNSLRCMYTNADSLHNKLDEFKQDVKNYDPDLIAINEV